MVRVGLQRHKKKEKRKKEKRKKNSSPNIIRLIKSRRMRLAEHVVRIQDLGGET